jgi:hypothetical protein
MRTRWIGGVVLMLCLYSNAAPAQLGTAFTYQGRLDDGGQPKNGTVDLRFDAFNVPTSGGSVNATPVILDAVALSNGVFTVQVDFGSGVFLGDTIFLEIGVREDAAGVAGDPNGFTTLAPRQAMTPVPYAIHADNVSLNAIGSAQVLDGTLTASDANTTSTSVGLQRRLTAACPAGQALTNITSSGTPACTAVGDITAVTTAAGSGLSGGATTGDTTLSIDVDETQARISGTCERGIAVINAISNNGSVDCTYIDTPTPKTALIMDATGDVGSHLSVRQESSSGVVPGIAYYDATNQRLKYVTCASNICTAPATPVILDDPANNVGQFPSVKFISPNLGVAYYDATALDLKLALCSNFDCSGTVSVRTLDTTGNVGRNAAIMSVNNRFAVAYFDATNNVYKYVRCNDAACTSPVARTLTGLGGGGLIFSAVVSVRDQNLTLPEFTVLKDGSDVVLVRCADVDCVSFTTTLVSASTDVGPPLAMMRATISGVVHRWFSHARPSLGSMALRYCAGDACAALVSPSGGSSIPNAVASGFALRDSLNPIYFQTRSSTETLIQSLAFVGPNAVAALNTMSGSATAQGAMDTVKVAFEGPGMVYYETGAQNLVLLRCVREDCSEL